MQQPARIRRFNVFWNVAAANKLYCKRLSCHLANQKERRDWGERSAITGKYRLFQRVTSKRVWNALGTEAAFLMIVFAVGLPPKGLGLRSRSQAVIVAADQSRVSRGEVESVHLRPSVTVANEELR